MCVVDVDIRGKEQQPLRLHNILQLYTIRAMSFSVRATSCSVM